MHKSLVGCTNVGPQTPLNFELERPSMKKSVKQGIQVTGYIFVTIKWFYKFWPPAGFFPCLHKLGKTYFGHIQKKMLKLFFILLKPWCRILWIQCASSIREQDKSADTNKWWVYPRKGSSSSEHVFSWQLYIVNTVNIFLKHLVRCHYVVVQIFFV